MKKIIIIILGAILFYSCQKEPKAEVTYEIVEEEEPKIIEEFGYILNNYKVIKDTIKNGESFGEILDRHHIDYPTIYKIAAAAKDTFDIRRLQAGKPYTILAKNDTTEQAQVFIYQPNLVEYLIVDFTDSIQTKFGRKEVKIVERTATGIIESSLSEAIEEQNLNYILAHEMSDIYAWTIDFFHLQKGDNFKLLAKVNTDEDYENVLIAFGGNTYLMKKDSVNCYSYLFTTINNSLKFNFSIEEYQSETYLLNVLAKPTFHESNQYSHQSRCATFFANVSYR